MYCVVTGSYCHVTPHPCYWNAPYTCYTAGHGYSCHGNPSLLAAATGKYIRYGSQCGLYSGKDQLE